MTNPLLQLADAGQSIWLDYFHRDILENGQLDRWISDDGVKGLTSNPSIFAKAIGGGGVYDARIKRLLDADDSARPENIYEQLAVADIQAAADRFRPVYDRLGGQDGYCSLEVSPKLADDTDGTVAEARRLWRAVGRPNLMIKVPGTKAGPAAIRQLISEGINVNVTLLFGLEAYLAVAEAHMAGLEAWKASGGDVSKVHGVASFFVSRIDTAIDKAIDARVKAGDAQASALKALRGKVATANAKVAYQRYLDMIGQPRWKGLAAAGAAPQRLLWASTGTKDPTYSDVLYVETLIGPETINTMPPATLEAFRDHGKVRPTLEEDVEGAQEILAETQRLGLGLDAVTDQLVRDGVKLFAEAFDELLGAVAEKQGRISGRAPVAHAT